jgi:hypothetical protein
VPKKTIPLLALSRTAAIYLVASSAAAHHSWSAEYDLTRSSDITGTIARVMIRHPHSALVLDVESASGRQQRWTVEWASPQRLRDRGVTEQTLRVGDTLLVTGNPHRDDEVLSLRALSVRRADGTEIGSRGALPEPAPGIPSTAGR